MSKPIAYSPEQGYKYQILCRNQSIDRAYEHCDYAKDKTEKNYLLDNYRQAYGGGWEFKVIELPMKYWPTYEVWDTLCYNRIGGLYLWRDTAEMRAKQEIEQRHLLPNSVIVREYEV